jgi:hypothetical protein
MSVFLSLQGVAPRRKRMSRIQEGSSSDDETENSFRWSDISVSSDNRILKFWEHRNLDSPAVSSANHPLRKIFVKFSKTNPPSSSKLALYLIAKALEHPTMIFYGLGILTCKSKWINDALSGGAAPSSALIETTKKVFSQLRLEEPKIMESVSYNVKNIRFVIAWAFSKAASSGKKAKKQTGHSWDKAQASADKGAAATSINEVAIVDSIYSYVSFYAVYAL